MRSEGGVAGGGAGVPSEAEADTVVPVVAVESISCVELLDKGVDCATVVAAARASAELVPPSMAMAKTEPKTVSAAEKSTRGWYWQRKQQHERRIFLREQKGRQSLHVARVCENRENR